MVLEVPTNHSQTTPYKACRHCLQVTFCKPLTAITMQCSQTHSIRSVCTMRDCPNWGLPDHLLNPQQALRLTRWRSCHYAAGYLIEQFGLANNSGNQSQQITFWMLLRVALLNFCTRLPFVSRC